MEVRRGIEELRLTYLDGGFVDESNISATMIASDI